MHLHFHPQHHTLLLKREWIKVVIQLVDNKKVKCVALGFENVAVDPHYELM